MKKSIALTASVFMMLSGLTTRVNAEAEIENITANTRVGDGQKEIVSFDITVSDDLKDTIAELTPADFDIANNVPTTILNPETGEYWTGYEDDGISLHAEGNVLHMDVKPFCVTGKTNPDFSSSAWTVTCTKDETFSFSNENVTDVKTQTLDDSDYQEITYAGLTRKYALYTPKNADGTVKKNVPLVIWNHGGGEYGADIMKTLTANRGFTAWNENGYETAVLCMQVANENYSYGAALSEDKKKLIDQNNAVQAEIVSELIAAGTVDADRVYVTGASSGGGATMRFLMQYPEMVAGAIAMCSMDPIVFIHHNPSFDYDTAVADLESAWQGNVYTWDAEGSEMVAKQIDTEEFKNVPIYFTHAESDPTCSVNSSKAYYESLANIGDTNNLIETFTDEQVRAYGISTASLGFFGPALIHWSWVNVLNETDQGHAMKWLFTQDKSPVSVTDVTVNTVVGYNAEEVSSIDITVDNADKIRNLTAENIDITGNISSNYLDPATGKEVTDFADDEITVTVEGNKIHIDARQFKLDNNWEIKTNVPGLTVTKDDVDSVVNASLDQAKRGEFTYAGITRKYALYVPKNADGTDKTNLPLVIWNHGGGEYNIDIEKTLRANRGLTAWNEEGYECAVLMFQVANENYSYAAALSEEKKELIDRNNALQAAFVRQLIKDGTVDADHVYVTGASSGGGATMRFLMQEPDLFAGAIAMCSMDPIVFIHHNPEFEYATAVADLEKAWAGKVYTWDETAGKMVETEIDTEALLNVPITFTHAENDPTCSVNSSKAYYESMKNLGDTNNELIIWSNEEIEEAGISSAKLMGQPYLLHWSWVKVFNEAGEGTPMAKLFTETKTAVNYSFLDEPVTSWTKGSKKDVRYHVNAPLSKFSALLIDGKEVKEDAYTLEDGSTVLTLKADYLESSASGKHTVTLSYVNGGKAETALTVADAKTDTAKASGSANTGDGFDGYLYGGIAGIAAIVAGIMIALRRRIA